MPSNKFEVLKIKVMNIGKDSEKEIRKDRKTILREERLKKDKLVEVWKIEAENSSNSIKKKEKLLREITVKIELKQEEDEEWIVVRHYWTVVQQDWWWVQSLWENKFKKKKLDKLIYVMNMSSIFNHKGPIEYTVEVELFYRGHKERTEIDVIERQK